MSSYTELKQLNPSLPILIRESAGTEATLWARYGAHPLPPSPPAPLRKIRHTAGTVCPSVTYPLRETDGPIVPPQTTERRRASRLMG